MGTRVYNHAARVSWTGPEPGQLWGWKCACSASNRGYETRNEAKREAEAHVRKASGR